MPIALKSLRRAMCAERLDVVMARRLNQIDQKRAFGLGYGHSVRARTDK
jgi:hypothetical protein